MSLDRDLKLLKPIIMMNTLIMGNNNAQLSTEGMRNINMGNYQKRFKWFKWWYVSKGRRLLQQNISPQMKRMLPGTNSNSC